MISACTPHYIGNKMHFPFLSELCQFQALQFSGQFSAGQLSSTRSFGRANSHLLQQLIDPQRQRHPELRKHKLVVDLFIGQPQKPEASL